MTPLFASPCDLAERMPEMAADFLELEMNIGRRFREDSVTDIIIASLLKIGGNDATVFTPPEVKTGGDFDLVIFQPATGAGVQYRIQSKRLIPNATDWAWSSYRELDHPHGSGKQASTLIRSSAHETIPTIPLYAFYNPASVCNASNGEIAGIQLADAKEINVIVRALVQAKAQGKRPRWKRVGYLQHLFFPLSTILCPPPEDTSAGSSIIRPEVSQQAALTAIEARRFAPLGIDDAPPRLHYRPEETARLVAPDSASQAADISPVRSRVRMRRTVPRIIERAIERQPEQPAIQRARIKRPKVILLARS